MKMELPESFIEGNRHFVNWDLVSKYQVLSDEFIERNSEWVAWVYISQYQKLSEDFIERNSDFVRWGAISRYQKLSEEFMERHQDKLDWNHISGFQALSEDFMERNKHLMNWWFVRRYQQLSEGFMERNRALLDCGIGGDVIYQYQKFALPLGAHMHTGCWVLKYQKLPREIIEKYNISIPENNWLYTDSETKLEAVRDTGLYEIEDGFIIAYKGIRSDNYSFSSFRYQYFPGNTYESHADFNLTTDSSFGLHAFTLEMASKRYNEKIIKVKIHPEDLAALVGAGTVLRCAKFFVVEEFTL